MCHWCSIQAFPRQNGDSTRPKDRKKPCIICRRIVKQIVSVQHLEIKGGNAAKTNSPRQVVIYP